MKQTRPGFTDPFSWIYADSRRLLIACTVAICAALTISGAMAKSSVERTCGPDISAEMALEKLTDRTEYMVKRVEEINERTRDMDRARTADVRLQLGLPLGN